MESFIHVSLSTAGGWEVAWERSRTEDSGIITRVCSGMAIRLSVLLQRELDEKLTVGDHSCRSEPVLPHSPLLEKSFELLVPVYVISMNFGDRAEKTKK